MNFDEFGYVGFKEIIIKDRIHNFSFLFPHLPFTKKHSLPEGSFQVVSQVFNFVVEFGMLGTEKLLHEFWLVDL